MGVGGQSHSPAALPPGKTRYPLYRRLGGPQGRSGQVRKISPPPGFDPRTVQPMASRKVVWWTSEYEVRLSSQKYFITQIIISICYVLQSTFRRKRNTVPYRPYRPRSVRCSHTVTVTVTAVFPVHVTSRHVTSRNKLRVSVAVLLFHNTSDVFSLFTFRHVAWSR